MILEKAHHIVGHEKKEALLVKALVQDKVFPVWIFHGIAGIGKANIAFKFAKCLLSSAKLQKNTLDIDLNNPTHKLVDSRIHPDFFILEQASESVSIDDVRKLFLGIRKTPAMSRRRVVILENASSLSKNIYNSLLKILEEPPRQTVIIMICDHIGIIPQTLFSRAAKIYFSPLLESTIRQILDNMNVKNSKRLARLSEGSVGYALKLSERNGIEIYDNILKAFSNDGMFYLKTLKWIIDNNLGDNFEIIKTSILRILKIYTDMLGGFVDEKFEEEIKILKPIIVQKSNPDYEVKKIQEIILMMNMSKVLMLDQNAIILNVFERFFKQSI